jgi:hypothetical protein
MFLFGFAIFCKLNKTTFFLPSHVVGIKTRPKNNNPIQLNPIPFNSMKFYEPFKTKEIKVECHF